jgi:RNA polymerase-binding transcription factor DksA
MNTLSAQRLRPLLRELDRRENELRHIVAQERDRLQNEGFAELTEQSTDLVDQAFARNHVALESGMIDRHLDEIRRLADARTRIENGIFGVCIDCNDKIAYGRLAANPTVARCAACQQKRERSSKFSH